jgi:hypothetical protein
MSKPMWEPLPDGDADRIVAECGRLLESESTELAPQVRFRLRAIHQAMEAAPDSRKTFSLKAVFDQIQLISSGAADTASPLAQAAGKAKFLINPVSFYNTYISGKKDDVGKRRFNFYVRSACRRLGLSYDAVIACVRHDQKVRFRLTRARREHRGDDSPKAGPTSGIQQLHELLGKAAVLMSTKGWGDEDVGRAYGAARSLEEGLSAESSGASEITLARLGFEGAIGLWSHRLVRGPLESAKLEASRLADIAIRTGDPSMRVVALRASGTTALWLGQFTGAERDLGECLIQLRNGSQYRPFATDLGVPPFSLVQSDLADALWALGRFGESLKAIAEARAQAVASRNPFHECYALAFSAWIRLKLRELKSAAEDAASLRELAHKYDLHALGALGRTLGGVIEASAAEDPKDGLSDTLVGLGEWKATGSVLLVCYFHAEAANIWLRDGDARHAELELRNAFDIAEKTGERYYSAEKYRLRGEIKLLKKKNCAAAEADFLKAMEIATGQQSPTFRLRAAMSLVQLSRAWNDRNPANRKRRMARYEDKLAAVLELFERRSRYADLRLALRLLAPKPP